jgi:hypothetical protein
MNDNNVIPIKLTLPPVGELAAAFGDVESLFNSRAWLRIALEANSAKIIGGGCGLGQADLDAEIDGYKFNVSIRPL